MNAIRIYKRSLEYFKKRFSSNIKTKDDVYTKRIMLIVKTLDSYNSYLLLTSGYEEKIWLDLTNNRMGMEKFIIEETGLYIRNCFNDEKELEGLIELVALSHSSLKGEDGVLNDVLLNKLPEHDEAVSILTDNIWLMSIIIIKDVIENELGI